MAEQCKKTILDRHEPTPDLPKSLQPAHLAWMCDSVINHSEDWAVSRLHRWIGFIQCALIANRMLDLEGARAMFNAAKAKYGDPDEDLLDHLDPSNTFELDIGGQG
jgi:hypothetical protein